MYPFILNALLLNKACNTPNATFEGNMSLALDVPLPSKACYAPDEAFIMNTFTNTLS